MSTLMRAWRWLRETVECRAEQLRRSLADSDEGRLTPDDVYSAVPRHDAGLGIFGPRAMWGPVHADIEKLAAAVHDPAPNGSTKAAAVQAVIAEAFDRANPSPRVDLAPLIARAATPTDDITRCTYCQRDSDPAILGDDGWTCVPCAESDPARAVVTSPFLSEVGLPAAHRWTVSLGDRQIGTLDQLGAATWTARPMGGSVVLAARSKPEVVAALVDRIAS